MLLGDNIEIFSKLSLPMFALFMMMFVNFTNFLLGKKMYYLIKSSKFLKHSIAYFNLLFFIILANERQLDESILHIIFYTTLVYTLVIMTLTLHPVIIAFVILMLLVIYVLNVIVKIKKIKMENSADIINDTKNLLSVITILVIVLGFFYQYRTNYRNEDF